MLAKDGFEVVGVVGRAGKNYYILERQVTEDSTYHYIVSEDFWTTNKDAPIVEFVMNINGQRIDKVISKTIFLSKGAVIRYHTADEGAKRILRIYRHSTENGLLEQAVTLAEDSDTPEANAVLEDIDRLLYYEDFSKEMEAPGIPFGFGYPGDVYGVMVGVGEDEELYVIFEEVHSYMEGYAVVRYKVPARFIMLYNSEKFKDMIKIIQDFYENKK